MNIDLSKTELELLNHCLMVVDYFDTTNASQDSITREQIAQRRILILPLRFKIYQLINQAREQG
jgi:hypothetical protein